MEEKEIYRKVLDQLYENLKIDRHDKFQNDRLGERKFAVDNLYPDILLTKKGTKDIEFIIEIVVKEHLNRDSLINKWKPLSQIESNFYLLVPKLSLKTVEKWCEEEKFSPRFGTYEVRNNEVEIKFN